ncbi:MAG TPA: lactoylglutathione lyase [Stellaceae bacterium]|nr:lactoylglutathione lyase [Stellaceae bacterium]
MDTAAKTEGKGALEAHGTRLLHTMVRVFDLDRSIDFYTRLLGMKLLRRRDVPEGRYTIAFVGYDSDDTNAVLELTHNWDQKEPYTIGSGFGHVAVAAPDLYKLCEGLAKEGVKIPRPPGPLKFGTVHMAFVEDPDGYKIELIQRQ